MMKHTLFALAGAMATIALASDPSPRSGDLAIDGFENYTAGQPIVSASVNWTGSSEATVRAYGDVAVPQPPIVFPQPFTNEGDNYNYLEIDSGSEEVTNIVSGATQDVVYIDTLAQFSVLKNGDPEPTAEDAKILLWLQEDVDGDAYSTNLYVKGGYYGDMEHPTPTTYKLNKTCQPGVWYRVTIAAYKNIVNDQYAQNFVSNSDAFPAFVISIDGTEVATTQRVYEGDLLGDLCPVSTSPEPDPNDEDCLSTFFFNLMRDNKLIPAIGGETAATVSQVAFKGTGAVDDFVVTELNPAQTYITLEWPSSLTTVFYMVGDTTNTLTVGSSPATIEAPGSTVTLYGGFGDYVKEVSGSSGTLTLPASEINYFFPRTATAGQDGTAEHPFEIADVDDLVALKDAVATLATARSLCYAQTANIDFTGEAAFAGIGTYNDSDVGDIKAGDPRGGVPFTGTYDGQGYKISNISFVSKNYAGVFNQVNGGTIKNLTVENATGSKGISIVGNAGNGATLQNLVAEGTFGSAAQPANHNAAGIAIRLSAGGAGTLVKDCTNNAAIYGTYTKLGGICTLTQRKVSGGAVTFDGCVNNGDLIMPSGSTAGRDGLAGIVAYSSDTTVLTNCANTAEISSTLATAKIGELVGYAYAGYTLTDQGNNTGDAEKAFISEQAGTINGFKYATVDNGVATTIPPPYTLVAGNTYLLVGDVVASETPVATLAVGQTVAFDEGLGYTFEGTVVAENWLAVSSSTVGSVTTYTVGSTWFPRTATAGQDGTAANPFEIADLDDLQAFKAAVEARVGYDKSYKLTATIDATSAGNWDGIGTYNNSATAFTGTLDGDGFTIANLTFATEKYRGFFDQLEGTVKNLTIDVAGIADTSSTEHGYAAFAGNTKNATFLNCVATGTIGTTAKPAMHTCGGFAVKVSSATSFTDCTNYVDIVCSLEENPKIGGFVGLSQGSHITNCWNYGDMTITLKRCGHQGNGAGGFIGYSQTTANTIHGGGNYGTIQSTDTTPSGSVADTYLGTLIAKTAVATTITGGTIAQADQAPAGVAANITGVNFATVDNNVATFVPDASIESNNTYKVMMGGATATYAFAAPGTIAFDTNMVQAVTFAITAAEGLTMTTNTVDGVVSFTASAPASSDYKVTINGVDVTLTPTVADLAALEAAGITGVEAVNEALNGDIGSTGIKVWQALFLGLPPTEAGLEAFAIKSIDFVNGNVTVTMADGVELKTGRGVDITLKVLGSNDLTFTTTSEVSSATNTKILPAITPALGETAKFYKVVVEFSATSNNGN